jgi:hypothetical protein
MGAEPPFRLPAFADGQSWTYEIVRSGKQGFRGRLTYTARALPDGGWSIEGASDYPEGRSLSERLELAGDPVRQRAAFFERRNATGVVRYEARQGADGSLWVRTERDGGEAREERHAADRGPVYVGNQMDFLLHGLDLAAGQRHVARLRAENGNVYPFEVRVVADNALLMVDGDRVEARLVTLKLATNPLIRFLAPPARYWFHPADPTALLRIEHGESTMTLVDTT